MATRENTIDLKSFSEEAMKSLDFESIIMNSLGTVPNFSVSVNGKAAKCDEISAPTVGMGFNKWTRGRAYSVIEYRPSSKQIIVETSINGFVGAAYNGKYAQEICDTLTSRIKLELKKASDVKQAPSQSSAADEILKYKKLLDMGAITQEEFDTKKAELLKK